MNRVRNSKVILAVVLVFVCMCFVPQIVSAQAIKTSVSEILNNPDRYDGKMVQVEGKISSLKFKTSKRGNPYTTFSIRDVSSRALNVFSFGTLSIKGGDSVVVMGRYNKVKHVPPRYTFHNEIDASEGSVENIR
jgi:hypothetical protein